MVKYRRLTREERYQIEALNRSGLSMRTIAKQLGRNASSISRELRRGSNCFDSYVPEIGERLARRRCLERGLGRRKIRGKLKAHVEKKLCIDWSPEQISGRLKRECNGLAISPQSIYRYIERDKESGGRLFKHLRILRKERKDRKKANWKPISVIFEKRTYLEERPKLVEKRERLGDYERDTVYGKANGVFLLTMVDRTSRLVKIARLEKKKSRFVHRATVRCLQNEPVKTITNDNGTEFARHSDTARELNADIYISHAFRSWERGTNENTNGLIRQYFPKRQAIGSLSEVKRAEKLLNSRPRKCLGFSTPNEIHETLKAGVLH